jgi:hypothetical protein
VTKQPSPFSRILIGRRAVARMIHLTSTGSGRKKSFAIGWFLGSRLDELRYVRERDNNNE